MALYHLNPRVPAPLKQRSVVKRSMAVLWSANCPGFESQPGGPPHCAVRLALDRLIDVQKSHLNKLSVTCVLKDRVGW